MTGSADHAGMLGDRRPPAAFAARVGTVAEWVFGILLLAVVAINVVNASGRYIFSYRVVGADELMVYTIILVVMGGAVLALARGEHISVNLVPSYARGRWRPAVLVLHDLTALAAAGYTAAASWAYVTKIARLGTRSMALGIPMAIPHAAVLAGFAGMTVVAFVLLVRDVRALVGGDGGGPP